MRTGGAGQGGLRARDDSLDFPRDFPAARGRPRDSLCGKEEEWGVTGVRSVPVQAARSVGTKPEPLEPQRTKSQC